MIIKKLSIVTFRNLKQSEINFNNYLNFFIGDNAQGKTNLLEAIYILSLLKSFKTKNDKELITFCENHYSLNGTYIGEGNIERKVSITYSPKEGKKIILDGKSITRYSDYIGQFPAVIFSSQDFEIITGQPSIRRKLINILISQCSAKYLYHLREYDRTVKQRNKALLTIYQAKHPRMEEIESWNIQLIKHGEPIIKYRHQFIDEINQRVNRKDKLFSEDEEFNVRYLPNVAEEKEQNFHEEYQKILATVFRKEVGLAVTLRGPHRDDFLFMSGDKQLRKFGSRGEQKSALVCLKLAECQMIKQRRNISPIIILDDILSEFDGNRAEKVIRLFFQQGQCFISGTDFDERNYEKQDVKKFMVNNGEINFSEQ